MITVELVGQEVHITRPGRKPSVLTVDEAEELYDKLSALWVSKGHADAVAAFEEHFDGATVETTEPPTA